MSSTRRAILGSRSRITPLAAAAVTLALFVALWALRPQPAQGVVGTNDPVPGQVNQLAVANVPTAIADNAPGNLVPFQIDNNPGPCFDANEEPIFTSMCPLEIGTQGGNPLGILDLEAPEDYCSSSPGGGDIESLIENSAPGTCLINEIDDCDPNKMGPWYDCVAVQDGNAQKVLDGVEARLAKDGGCDGSDAGGVDDFFETINLNFDTGDPLTSTYEARDCDDFTPGKQMSPRLVSLIVLEEPPIPGTTGYPILAFADFYIAGCASESVVVVGEDDLDRYCGPGFPEPGHAVIYGRFVNIISCADLNDDGLPPWSIPAGDSDCDGYSATDFVVQRAPEAFLGTDPMDKCADTPATFDERGPDFGEPLSPWPPDINDDGKTTLQDALAFGAHWNAISGQDANYTARFDLNGDGKITLPDVLSLAPFFNLFCHAPAATSSSSPTPVESYANSDV